MPRLPVEVVSDVTPNIPQHRGPAYIDTQASPGSFGAYTARGAEQLGGAEEKFGDALAGAAIAQQQQKNETQAAEADTTATRQLSALLNGPGIAPGLGSGLQFPSQPPGLHLPSQPPGLHLPGQPPSSE